MSNTLVIPSIFTAVDKFSTPVRAMSRNVSGFQMKTEAFAARGNRAFRSMTAPIRSVNNALGGFGVAIGGALFAQGVGNAIGIMKNFEQANANLSSVMSSATVPQLKQLQADAIRLGSVTAKSATEVVGLQEAFARLGFTTPQILNMTEATISGSIAMNSELSETADLVGAVIKTFNNFSSIDTPLIMNQMVASTQQSALNFEKLQTALPIVAGAANAAGVDFTTLLALLGKLSDSGIDASSSANALKNIFIRSKAEGKDFGGILKLISKEQDKLTASVDSFGVRASVSSAILANNLSGIDSLKSGIIGAGNVAEEAAKKQLNTLNGALTLLSSAYEGFILNVDKGDGAFRNSLVSIVQTVTEMLSLASGTAKATDALSESELRIRKYANTAITVLKIIGLIIASMIAFKVILIATSVVLGAYNIALGIMGALTGTASLAIGSSTIALTAYKIALAVVTAAQWAWAAALNIGIWPLTLIALGIAATIALITVIVKKWDEWGAALSVFLGLLGLVISLVQSFRRNWDMIVGAFKNQGILEGFKAIGVTIIDALLMPLQQVFELIQKMTGVDIFGASSGIQDLRNNLLGGVKSKESANSDFSVEPAINPFAARQDALNESIIEQRQTSTLNIKGAPEGSTVESNNNSMPIILTPNFGF